MTSSETAKKDIADRLRLAREQAGLSQGQVARMLDWHRPTISQIEAAQRAVKAEEIKHFAKLYDVKESWLINGESVLPGKLDPRIELAARELSKLKKKDLDSILHLMQILRTRQDEP